MATLNNAMLHYKVGEHFKQIRERLAAATPGYWRWRGNKTSKSIDLRAIIPQSQRTERFSGGVYTVMGFFRWGPQGAEPRFLDDSNILRRPTLIPSAPHNAWDIVGIDHPDARLIEHSREDIEFLLNQFDGLVKDVRHYAQMIHQAHHKEVPWTWEECELGVCPGIRRSLERALGDVANAAVSQSG